MNEEERRQILEMIEKGIISAAEGVRLLNSIQGEPEELPPPAGEAATPAAGQPVLTPPLEAAGEQPEPEDPPPAPAALKFEEEINRWRRWYWIPLSVGIGITIISGLFMFLAYLSSGFGFWFACLWLPLLLGVGLISLAAASRTARWMHVRVQQAEGEHPRNIRISMPVPIRLVSWVFRVFKPHIPGMNGANLDEVVMALEKVSPQEPLYVKVDEGESGEKVEVFIG